MTIQYQAQNTPDADKAAGRLPYQVLADTVVIGEFLSPDDASLFMQQKHDGKAI